MIAAKYTDSKELFDLVQKLKEESMSNEGQEILKQLENKLMLFECPSCHIPIILPHDRSSWEKAFLDCWSRDLESSISKIGSSNG